MIVIATNNGKNYLHNLLNCLNEVDLCNQAVLIVDTKSEEKDYLDNINKLNLSYNYKIVETPYRGYDTGAYIFAYNNFYDENYIFLQDSILIKNPSFIKDGLSLLRHDVVVPIIVFGPNMFDGEDQKNWLKNNLGSYEYNLGFFGPMFFVKRSTLDMVDKQKLLIPTNKTYQMGMERGWPIIFNQINVNILPLERKPFGHFHNDGYDYIKKFFPVRT